ASALTECLLDLALQRNLGGFQQALKRTLEQFNLYAWAVIFPPSSGVGGRPLFMAHGVRPANSPLLTRAAKDGFESVFPAQGFEARQLQELAKEISPGPTSRCQILRIKRD